MESLMKSKLQNIQDCISCYCRHNNLIYNGRYTSAITGERRMYYGFKPREDDALQKVDNLYYPSTVPKLQCQMWWLRKFYRDYIFHTDVEHVKSKIDDIVRATYNKMPLTNMTSDL